MRLKNQNVNEDGSIMLKNLAIEEVEEKNEVKEAKKEKTEKPKTGKKKGEK